MNNFIFLVTLSFYLALRKADGCLSNVENMDNCIANVDMSGIESDLRLWCLRVNEFHACFDGCTMAEIDTLVPGYEESIFGSAEKLGCKIGSSTCDFEGGMKCNEDLKAA